MAQKISKAAEVSILAPKSQALERQVRMVFDRTALMSLDESGTVPPESPGDAAARCDGADTSATLR